MKSFVVLAGLVLAVVCGASAWTPDRVHYIDSSTQYPNYLFRGAIPLTKDRVFQMEPLQNQLRIAAAFENVTLPDGPLYIVGTSIS